MDFLLDVANLSLIQNEFCKMNSPLKTKWLCRICLKYLSSKRSYDEHMNIHNESRPFGCDQCSYAAASQMTLRRHKLRNHIPRQHWGYQCPYCMEAYMEPASYQQHVLTRHFGHSATFGCPQNGCAFTTKSSKHFREHYGKHIVVMSNQRFPTAVRRFASLKPDLDMSAFLVDDELGSGYGKEAIKPIASRVSNLLVLTKQTSSNNNKTPLLFTHCAKRSKNFTLADKEFFKSPINLDAIGNSSQLIRKELKTPNKAALHLAAGILGLEEAEKECKEEEEYDEMSAFDDPCEIPTENVDWIESEIEIIGTNAVDQPQLLVGQNKLQLYDIELD